ncbi:hypothetical protein ACWGH5_09685 [Streptomyces sp. NPDC054864]
MTGQPETRDMVVDATGHVWEDNGKGWTWWHGRGERPDSPVAPLVWVIRNGRPLTVTGI